MLGLADYTVGWICALDIELAAALGMLDERHGPQALPPNDRNSYNFGRIGNHNVVIACLPLGVTGTIAAAQVATQMTSTFTELKFGLMVGIGGGVPSKEHDIRLGDVVVSKPTRRSPGVVQYDMGKTVQKGRFRRTGSLNKPPKVLLTALTNMKSMHKMEGHDLTKYISEIAEKHHIQGPPFTHPGIQDSLYQAKYDHPPGPADCSKCDAGKLVIREPRASLDPLVHYGLIASGNQVMKHGTTRDRLKGDGVLCYEMEAAGLMDHIPCLVIRGICDYADSHKNNSWQPYAAATAAAYAKELLGTIPGHQVAGTLTIKHFIEWISPLNPWITQQDIFAKHQEGTGEWFLNSVAFQNWVTSSENLLWCPGNPGAGKTILTSVAVNYLRETFKDRRDVGVAVIYFNYKEKDAQTPRNMIASLCAQLIGSKGSVSDELRALYDKHLVQGTHPAIQDLSGLLKAQVSSFSTTYIVVDGLDECPDENSIRSTLLSQLRPIQLIAKLMVTSRHHLQFSEDFSNGGVLEIRANEQDVRKYLSSQMHVLPKCVERSPGLKAKIINTIAQAADGLFILVRLYLDSLSDKLNVREIKTALDKLPTGSGEDALAAAYGDALKRIDGQKPNQIRLANTVLHWVIHATRSLTVTEMQHALAIKPDDADIDKESIYDEEMLTKYCAGLLIVDPVDRKIRLVHKTTQEFFESIRETRFSDGHAMVVERSLAYLSLNVFATDICPNRQDMYQRLFSYPFAQYAAEGLAYHARQNPKSQNQRMVLDFLKRRRYLPSLAQILLVRHMGAYSVQYMRSISELDVAAHLGLEIACGVLLESGFDINSRDALEITPLHRAASMGHVHVVKLLLDKGADIAARSHDLLSPLGSAAMYGHEPVARMLLEHDADGKMTQPEKMRALYDAFFGGHQAVCRLLLEKNFDGTMDNTASPVHTVVESRDTAALKHLLNGEANINVKGRFGRTPLHIAVAQNDLSCAEVLLDHGADVTVTNSAGVTPLSLARRNHEMLQKLIDKRHEQINAPEDRFMHTVLILAAVEGNLSGVKFLLSKGADPGVCDIFEETPLHYAAEGGHLDIVKALVEAGSDLQLLDTGGRTPLRCAQLNQHSAVVDYLAPRTRTVENLRRWTELHYASWTGHWLLVTLFVHAGFSVSAQACDGATPLHLAAGGGHLVVVKSLLAAGADREALDKENRTPLDYAKQNRKDAVVRYLDGTGTAGQVHDEKHKTPWAQFRCKECENHRWICSSQARPSETKPIVECPNCSGIT